MDPDLRREQILQVASRHFASDGRAAVSVRDIAEEAGVTRALIYHYFPGKDALLEAVIRRESDRFLEATAPIGALSANENLERALGIYLDLFSASGGQVRQLYEPASNSPSLFGELTEANHAIQVARVREYLALEDTPMVSFAIRAWLGLVTDAARQRARSPTISREEVVELCMSALRAVTLQLPPSSQEETP